MNSFFDNTNKIITIAAASCLCLSVLYDWGYFFAFGLSFAQVQTTISDHVRSALVWLPETVLLFAVLAAISPWPEIPIPRILQTPFTFGVGTQNKGQLRPQHPRLVGVVALIAWGGAILIGDKSPFLFFTAVTLSWGFLFTRAISHPALRDRLSLGTWRTALWLPIVPIIVFSFGYTDAHASLYSTFSPSRIYWQPVTTNSPQELQILRQFEKFLLARDKNNNVILLKSEQIFRIEGIATPLHVPGLLCTKYGWSCTTN